MDLNIVNTGEYLGYEYIVRKLSLNSYRMPYYYCGYVAIPKGHRLYQVEYDRMSFINCHGGLTFSDKFDGYDDVWFIGFDCAHAWDHPTEQDADYTENECLHIINQIVEMDGTA